MTGAEEITGHYSTASDPFVNRAGILLASGRIVTLETNAEIRQRRAFNERQCRYPYRRGQSGLKQP